MVRRLPWVWSFMPRARPSPRQNVETDPLQCWWRTSAGAVRVGEPFTVVLTCAVLETEAATVVVDQSRLEPSVVQFAPFEVLGGSHGADLRTDQRRFFQYVYRLRLIAENLFGKDVSLPETKLSYRVQTKVNQRSASLQGRDQTYLLPAQSVRVMSLVPADATDIRDTSGETFGDLDQRAFRANLFTIIGSVLFVLAGLMALLALVRLARRYRTTATVSDRLMTDGDRAARRRPRACGRPARARPRRMVAGSGGTRARRAAHCRHLHGRAPGQPAAREQAVGRRRGRPGGRPADPEGGLAARPAHRGLRRRDVADDRARARARHRQRPPRRSYSNRSSRALTAFTTAHFGREGALDEAALDESLGDRQAGRSAA